MKQIISTAIIAALTLLAGCARSVSHLQPYSQYIDKDLTLKRPMILHEQLEDEHGNALCSRINPDGSLSDLLVVPYSIPDPDSKYVDSIGIERHLIHVSRAYINKFYLEGMDSKPNYDPPNSNVIGSVTRRYWTLPVGSMIRVHKVQVEIGDGYQGIIAYGTTKLTDQDKTVPFSYSWGFFEKLERAPWEDSSVPEIRYVGRMGNKHSD